MEPSVPTTSTTTPEPASETDKRSSSSSAPSRTSSRPAVVAPAPQAAWTVYVCPTTGGQFPMRVTPHDCIEGLKRTIAQRLKIPKERLTLLYRDRLLKDGSLRDNGVSDASKITLLPNVESGLMSQKPDHSVMQALENLSDNQVNEFLGGRSPLTLAMRLGDHMVFVQLQLSTSPPNSKRSSSSVGSPSVPKHYPKPASPSNTTVPHLSKPIPMLPVVPPTPVPAPVVSPSMLPLNIVAQPSGTVKESNNTSTSSATNKTQTVYSSSSTSSDSSSTSTLPSSMDTSNRKNKGEKKITPILDSMALVEASRNLQQKLKELSQVSSSSSPVKEVQGADLPPSPTSSSSSSSSSLSSPPASPSLASSFSPSSLHASSGAIIESMQHHGQGVYSGTFSGTLNPALQDRDGKPKRSINTIVHILNDLLGASPQYRAHMHHHHHHHHHHRMHHHHHRHHNQHHHHHHHRAPSSPTVGSKNLGEQLRLSQENRAMRGKMEQIQLMLEERRLRRQARRQARSAPYPSNWSRTGASQAAPNQDGACPMEVDNANLATNVTGDKVQENNYNELKQETVLV